MGVDKAEAIQCTGATQHLHRLHQLPGGKTELGVVPARVLPLTRSGRHQFDAHPKPRAHIFRFGNAKNAGQFAQLFRHQKHRLAELLRQQSQADVSGVLEAVADDDCAGGLQRCQGGVQLGLGAHLQAHAVLRPEPYNLFDHLALLIDLERIDAAIFAPVAMPLDGARKARLQVPQPVRQDIGKTDQQRERKTLRLRIVDQRLEVNSSSSLAEWEDRHVSAAVHAEIAAAPALHVV